MSFERETEITVSSEILRDWHFHPGAFRRLTPPWENAKVLQAPASLADGARAVIDVGPGPIPVHWVAEHHLTEDGFIDRQVSGPFSEWEHRHRFLDEGDGRSRLVDSIRFRLPGGALGARFGEELVRRKLDRMFRYRHETTRLDLERATRLPGFRPLEVLITGASGLVGTDLSAYLETLGHRVHRVTRTPATASEIPWNPREGSIKLPPDARYDAVIHLAGENIAGRWTDEKKKLILRSRVEGTGLVAKTVAALPDPPAVFLCASGSNAYPSDGYVHDETGPFGDTFLAQVCREWETAATPACEAGIRTVFARIGAVLTSKGALLGELLPPFRLGLGGVIGPGTQRTSWIAIDDLVDALHSCLFDRRIEGPVNFTAPEPVTISDFSRTLASVLHRPAPFRIPASALRAIFGQMAEETILADMAVVPAKLLANGYTFRYPDLEGALRHCLGRPAVS